MSMWRTRAYCGVLVAAIAGGFLMAGCGGDSATSQAPAPETPQAADVNTPPRTEDVRPAPATAPATGGAPSGTVTTAPEATPAAVPGALVQEHETGVEVTLVEVRRTGGDSVTVKWRYRNTSANDVQLSKGGSSWIDPYRLTAEAFLVDSLNKKKYLVITDDQRVPLTSKHGDWQGVTLAPGQSLSAWAKFPAPPAGVEKVTVTIPGVPPFEDAPIIR